MKSWVADFSNDPFDDYSPIVEILCDEEEVAVIKKRNGELEVKLYPTEKEVVIPLKWLLNLLSEVEKRMQE